MANYAFKDMRSQAELMLAPYKPASRSNMSAGSLRLDIGGKVDLPGVITKPTQLTGALRGIFGAAIKAKQMTQALGGVIQATTSYVGTLAGVAAPIAQIGPAVALTTKALSVAIPRLPGAQDFLQTSASRVGSLAGTAGSAIIKDRANQMQALSKRMSSLKSSAGLGGVTVIEDYARTTYPLQSEVDQPSMAKLAVGGAVAQKDSILKDKAKFIVSGVQVAKGKPSFWSRFTSLAQVTAAPGYSKALNLMFKDRTSSGGWSEPPSPYGAQFPYNKVTATESGHVFELDDTPAAERIHIFHRSGSFIEFHPNGTVVIKNMKDGYFLTMNNQHVKVSGNCHIAVDGNATVYAKKDLNVQSDGEITLTAKKDFNVYAKNINLNAKQTFKGDGTKINLRYINLPFAIVPTMSGFVPLVNLAALKADFPRGNFDKMLEASAKKPLDPKTIANLMSFGTSTVPTVPEIALSNPGIYDSTEPAARQYRARMFDTPEETENFEIYNAHIDLMRQVGDIIKEGDPKPLGGQLIGLDTAAAVAQPPVNYLNFDAYKGKFTYPDNWPVSGSFVLRDLVDTALFPDIVPKMKEATLPDIPSTTTTGGGGAGGGGTDGDGGRDGGRAGSSR